MYQAFLPGEEMTSAGNKCHKKLDLCPKGHEMEDCQMEDGDQGRYCKQCGSLSYQPNRNRYGDNCRLRKICDNKRFMDYKKYGSKIEDAECKCNSGYHFENEDQRACVPNSVCQKGYGQGMFEDGRLTGICELCLKKNMWSDTENDHEKCKPLRNCEKESRCTIVESDGTMDNKCGRKVNDITTDCDNPGYETTTASAVPLSKGAIAGIVLGSFLVVILLILFVVCLLRRRQQSARRAGRLTKAEMDELLQDILKRSRKDEVYCKKVLTTAQKEIEDNINNQIWALPQELFRNHLEPAKYEVMLEKYKEKQHKFAINGYLQDWRGWRGDTAEAVQELVDCLKSAKVNRDDIVYRVVMLLREDYPQVDAYGSGPHKRSTKSSFCAELFPCLCKDDEKDFYETKETSSKLLDEQVVNEKYNIPGDGGSGGPHDGGQLTPTEAGVIYRDAPMPSAPIICDDVDYEPSVEVKGRHFYDRSDSLPVQASS